MPPDACGSTFRALPAMARFPSPSFVVLTTYEVLSVIVSALAR
jgi:hypothetical protein